jgi:glycosyltransferase involved in cell wall biosynthesis
MSQAAWTVSVVIPNYNYDAFLGAAIDSALALDWPDVEVIVVDDGSTDNSRAVIERYGDRVTKIYQANAGQAAACEAGFTRSRGDVVIFLDSDDLLDPSVAREAARVWHAGVSKVQFQMKAIDARGLALGTVFPQFHTCPTPMEIRSWVLTTSAYPTPPGSGNAYSRRLLERVLPFDGSTGKFSDSYLLAAAPFYGDVVTVPRPLVSYRVHGRNDGALSSLDVNRFGREVSRGMQRFAYAQRVAAKAGFELPSNARDKSLSTLPYRLASLYLAPDRHPVPMDSSRAILRDVLRAVAAPQGVTWRGRLTLLLWSVLVLAMPAFISRHFILWRFAPGSRPPLVRMLLTGLRIVQ